MAATVTPKTVAQANKPIIKAVDTLAETSTVAQNQVDTAQKNLTKAVNKTFTQVKAAINIQTKETKKLAKTITKATSPIAQKKTKKGDSRTMTVAFTNVPKEASIFTAGAAGADAKTAMMQQRNIVNTQK